MDCMERFQATVHDFAFDNMEAEIEHLERKVDLSIAKMVQQEVDGLALTTTLSVVARHQHSQVEDLPPGRVNLFLGLGSDFLESEGSSEHNGGGRPVARATPETMWDAAVLAGLSAVRPMGTFILLASLLLSISLQAGVLHVFTFGQLPHVNATAVNATAITPSSVDVKLTLEALRSAPWSFPQPKTNGTASNSTVPQVLPTPWTLRGALLLWIFSVACEFKRALGTALALWLLPRCATRLARCNDRFLFVSMSSSRLILVAAVTFLRVCMAWALLTHGALCLERARSLTDLALVIGALGVILDVPKFVWSWGCNGGHWTTLLAIETRVSFAESMLESECFGILQAESVRSTRAASTWQLHSSRISKNTVSEQAEPPEEATRRSPADG